MLALGRMFTPGLQFDFAFLDVLTVPQASRRKLRSLDTQLCRAIRYIDLAPLTLRAGLHRLQR